MVFNQFLIKNSSDTEKGYLSLLASALSFSLMTVCVKHLNGRIPVAEIILTRSLISIIITRAMIRELGISPWGTRRYLLLIRGLLGTAALFCVFYAISVLPLAAATILHDWICVKALQKS